MSQVGARTKLPDEDLSQYAFAQKVLRGAKQVRYWERIRRPRPHRSHAQFLKIWRINRSRFALIAGEGARAPSDDGLIPTQIDLFWARPRNTAFCDGDV